jgi:hypothetical protein
VVTTTYEVRIAGPVAADLVAELGDVTITGQETRTMMLGSFADQAALHGFLQRLRAYGLELVEIRRVTALGEQAPPPGPAGGPEV